MVISNNDLTTIYGGKITASKAASFGIVIGIIATFIIGVIDGFKRPLACN